MFIARGIRKGELHKFVTPNKKTHIMSTKALGILLMAALFLSACNTEQKKLQEEITKLEKAVEETPNPTDADELLRLYQEYVVQYPDDADFSPRYLYRAAALQYRQNRSSSAINHLNQAISGYYEDANTPQSMLFLGDVYQDNMRNEESAYTVYQALIQAFPNSEQAALAAKKLPDSLPSLEQRINDLGTNMFDDSTKRFDYRTGNNFIISSELYAMLLPKSEEAPAILYKAGDAARSIRSFNKALELYGKITANYPDYEKAPMALFLQAFTYDSDLRRYEEAKPLYEQFIAKYPTHDFADDAQASLDNLGKSDEEILRYFEDKSKEAEEAGIKQATEEE